MNRQRVHRSESKKSNVKVGDHIFEGMSVIRTDVAGIDIGSDKHFVSVPPDRDEKDVRNFGCYTPDLVAMAEWLKACRITSVVMESTGVYWVPSYQVLTEAGFDVQLVDAHYAKNVPGRKTDVWDAKWLRKLHTFGMLRGCFIPPPQVLELRSYWRHRATLVEGCSQQVLRMQKALEQMNLQLHKAISDIAGVTGMRILRAIVAGERDPVVLAHMRNARVKASEEEIVKALTGHYLPVHVFALKQALATYDFLHAQMQECDEQIRACMALFEDASDADPTPTPPTEGKEPKRRRNDVAFEADVELKRILGVDLTRVTGISTQTAMAVLTEVGPDLSKFPNDDHFSSWMGVCPNHRITGGRIKSNRTRKVNNRLACAFRLAALSVHRSQTAIGAFYRRIAAKHGAPKAITATAHKLAKLVYLMLTRGEEYVAVGQAEYEKQYNEQRLRNLQRLASSFGFNLVDAATGAVVS
jgi:transposase